MSLLIKTYHDIFNLPAGSPLFPICILPLDQHSDINLGVDMRGSHVLDVEMRGTVEIAEST